MANVPWPSELPGTWETMFLASVFFPGLVKIKVKGGQKIDRKDAPGADGESTTQQGEKAKDVEIAHRLWTPEQWDEMEQAFPIVEPIIGKRKPVDIVTAATASRHITAVLIETVEGPDWDDSRRWMEYRYHCIEHKPTRKKNATSNNTGAISRPITIFEANRRDSFANETNGRILIGQAGDSAARGFVRPGT